MSCRWIIEEGAKYLMTKNKTHLVMRASYVECPRCHDLQEMPQTFINATDATQQLREYKRRPPSKDELEPIAAVLKPDFQTKVVWVE
jgi:hypothetical protein